MAILVPKSFNPKINMLGSFPRFGFGRLTILHGLSIESNVFLQEATSLSPGEPDSDDA